MPNTAVTALTHAVLMLIGLPSKGDAQFALYENVADGFSDPNLLWQSISTEGSFSGPTAEARRVTVLNCASGYRRAVMDALFDNIKVKRAP